jgi:hypothetical protein
VPLQQLLKPARQTVDFISRLLPKTAISGCKLRNSGAPEGSAGWTLAHTADGRWIAQSDEGLYHDFGRAADLAQATTLRLQSIQDDNGNFIALHHQADPDGNMRLVQVIDSAKRLYDLQYDPQHPQRIAGRIIRRRRAGVLRRRLGRR